MKLSKNDMDECVVAYMATALWSSTGEDGEPMENTYDVNDLSPKARKTVEEDIQNFLDLLSEDVTIRYNARDLMHDFWLTRNRHGAGFWDGDYPKPLADELTKWAHSFGGCDLYSGDDDKLHIS